MQKQEAVNHGNDEPTSHPDALMWAQVCDPDRVFIYLFIHLFIYLVYTCAGVCAGCRTFSNIIPKES